MRFSFSSLLREEAVEEATSRVAVVVQHLRA
jgi:hypothetical protein